MSTLCLKVLATSSRKPSVSSGPEDKIVLSLQIHPGVCTPPEGKVDSLGALASDLTHWGGGWTVNICQVHGRPKR